MIHVRCDERFRAVSKTHSPRIKEKERRRRRGSVMRGRERRVLEEYHRKARQMGRNIDMVTRKGKYIEEREKQRVSVSEWVKERDVAVRRAYGMASYICDYTRRRVYNDGGWAGMGSIALYPDLFFRSLERTATFFHALTACEYLFPLGMRVSTRFVYVARRKVNYIIRMSFRAIATVSNVSRRGILNILSILRWASFLLWR